MSRPVPPHSPAGVFARLGLRALALGGMPLVLLAACGEPPGRSTAAPAAAPAPASPTGSPAVHARPLLAVLDKPLGSLANTLRLLRPDGTQAAATILSDNAEAVAMAGRRALVAGDGVIQALDEKGAFTRIEHLAPAAATDIVRGIVAAPDGATWAWTVLHRDDDGTLHSRIYLGADGAEPRLLADRTSPDHALTPLTWSGQTPVLSDDPVGIGGYILFRHSFGQTDRLDTLTGALTRLTPDTCALTDIAVDGTTACVLDSREGPHGSGPVTLRVTSPTGTVHDTTLPQTVAQAGAALFSPDGRHLTLASSPAQGTDAEVVTTELLDTVNWSRYPLGTGLVPAGWVDDTVLAAVRDPGMVGGDPGVYLVDVNGTSARLAAGGSLVGISGG